MSDGITGTASAVPGPSLVENEAIIERGLTSFVEVGQALMRIRDGRQYTHATFEDYLHQRWQMSRPRGYQLIDAAVVVQVVSTNVDTPPPETEGVARELKSLKDDPNELAEVWKATVKEHGPKPTAKQVRAKVQEHRPPKSRQKTDAGASLWEDDDVLTWVAKRMKAGKSTYQIRDESKAGMHGWPFSPGTYLGQNASEKAVAIIRDRQRRGDTNRRRQPKESGKRLRQLHAEKRAGRTGDLWHLQKAVAEAVGMLEGFDLPKLDWSEENEELVVEIYDDLERHARWNDAAIDVVTAHMDELGRQRKIKALRARADDPSSTPSERATAARLAEKLERRRSAARLSS